MSGKKKMMSTVIIIAVIIATVIISCAIITTVICNKDIHNQLEFAQIQEDTVSATVKITVDTMPLENSIEMGNRNSYSRLRGFAENFQVV